MATDTRPLGLSYGVCHWDACRVSIGFCGLWGGAPVALACSAGAIRLGSWEFGSRVHYPAKERLLQPMLLRGVLGLQKCSSWQQVSEPHSYEWQDPVFPSSVAL